MEFGSKIREYRKEKGLTQRELAKRAGIDFTYLSKLETGDMPPPSDAIIERIATELEVDADELFLLAQKVPPQYREQILHDKEVPQILRMAKESTEFRQALEKFVESWRKEHDKGTYHDEETES